MMMTVDEFLALPDDGVHRELIEGKVRVVCQEREVAHLLLN